MVLILGKMDPIMKLLEEDEDENMHSEADVNAFTAALSRHMEGDSSASQPSESNAVAVMSQGMDQIHFFHQLQNSSQDVSSLTEEDCVSSKQKQTVPGFHSQQHFIDVSRSQETGQSPLQSKQEDAIEQTILQPLKPSLLQIPEINARHVSELGITPNNEREARTFEQGSNGVNMGKLVPFAPLLSLITQLEKERAMLLNYLYLKLKKNQITKDGFIKLIRSIVGDKLVKTAIGKLLSQEGKRNSQRAANQDQLQSQGATREHILSMPSASAPQFLQTFGQAHQQGHSSHVVPSQRVSSAGHVQAISQKAQDEHQPVSHGMQPNEMVSSSLYPSSQEREWYWFTGQQSLRRQQQQHLHVSSASFPRYRTSSGYINQYSGVTNTSSAALKPQHHPLVRPASLNQNLISTQSDRFTGTAMFDRAYRVTDANRMHVGYSPYMNALQHHSFLWKSESTGDHLTCTSVQQEPIDQGIKQHQRPQSITAHGLSSVYVKPGPVPGASKEKALDKEAGMIGFQASTFPAYSATSTLSAHQDSQSIPRIPAVQLAGNIGKGVPKIIGQKKPLETSSPPLSSKKQKVPGGFLDQSIEQLNDVTAIGGVNLREEEEHLFSGPKKHSRVSEATRRVVQEEEARFILQRVPLQKKLEGIILKCGVRSKSDDVEGCLSLCVEERMRGLIRNLIRLSKQRSDTKKLKHRTIDTSDVCQQILLMNSKCREEWEKKQAETERLRKLCEPGSSPATDGEKEREQAHKENKQVHDKRNRRAANVAARAAVGGDDMLAKWQLMAEQAQPKRYCSSDAASSSQPSLPGTSPHSAAPGSAGAPRISVKDVIEVLEREPQMSQSPLLYGLHNAADLRTFVPRRLFENLVFEKKI